jgi:hypothetical protein
MCYKDRVWVRWVYIDICVCERVLCLEKKIQTNSKIFSSSLDRSRIGRSELDLARIHTHMNTCMLERVAVSFREMHFDF